MLLALGIHAGSCCRSCRARQVLPGPAEPHDAVLVADLAVRGLLLVGRLVRWLAWSCRVGCGGWSAGFVGGLGKRAVLLVEAVLCWWRISRCVGCCWLVGRCVGWPGRVRQVVRLLVDRATSAARGLADAAEPGPVTVRKRPCPQDDRPSPHAGCARLARHSRVRPLPAGSVRHDGTTWSGTATRCRARSWSADVALRRLPLRSARRSVRCLSPCPPRSAGPPAAPWSPPWRR